MDSRVYQWAHTVAQTDIDELGHANNTAYIRYCEAAGWAHSAALGLTVEDWHRLDRALAIVRAEYDYHKPGFSGEELRIETWLSDCDGKVSLNRNFRLYREHELLVSGTWKLYCIPS